MDIREKIIDTTETHGGMKLQVLRLKNNYSTKQYIWSCIKDDIQDNAPSQLEEHFGQLNEGQFWIELIDFIKCFRGTYISVDTPSRAHYSVTSAGVDMSNDLDCFLSFKLTEPLDCNKETMGIMCE
jgi:hypothetical protein